MYVLRLYDPTIDVLQSRTLLLIERLEQRFSSHRHITGLELQHFLPEHQTQNPNA